MTRAVLSRLPIFACAGFILFLFTANIWNFAVERDWPKLRIRSASPLFGLAKPKPASWTVDAFLSGETQKAVSNILGRSLPVFPISVRAKNQLVYSLFGDSAARGVAIGRNGQLFEQGYIDEFCARGGAPDIARIETWAAAIREIQDALASAGKTFVYLISPSKAARYAEDLPRHASCAARVSAIADKLWPYHDALKSKGVHFVDGAGLITANRGEFEIPLFPRGGTHWNYLGAALALRAITDEVGSSPIGRFEFAWTSVPEAVGTDRDLVDLLNLLWPDISYPTAIVTRLRDSERCDKTPKLLALGGSFVHEVLAAATQAPCPPRIDYWFYMRTEDNGVELGHFRRAPGDASNGERLSGEPAALDENLLDTDIVLLEENESNIATTKQVGHLLEAVQRMK